MRELIARLFGRLVLALIPGPDPRATLVRWAERLFPASGRHRAPAPTPAHHPEPWRKPWPAHRSPYAAEAAAPRPFLDTIDPVRPYLTAPSRNRPATPKERAGAYRLWVIDMALRGIDGARRPPLRLLRPGHRRQPGPAAPAPPPRRRRDTPAAKPHYGRRRLPARSCTVLTHAGR
ncbi:hypothetical protein [Streptomyces sp. 8N706]|uniref:hypothetical protein n=1 Tax=Streptomyces sp. 8N706 TaxID=3457416 RepID=UPI003FD34E6D